MKHAVFIFAVLALACRAEVFGVHVGQGGKVVEAQPDAVHVQAPVNATVAAACADCDFLAVLAGACDCVAARVSPVSVSVTIGQLQRYRRPLAKVTAHGIQRHCFVSHGSR